MKYIGNLNPPFSNNCIKKSLKIKTKSEEPGKRADLVCCISVVPIKRWHNIPTINPHVYNEIDGKEIDVSLDPGHEKIYCKNSEKKIILPVNISKLGRIPGKRAISTYLSTGDLKGINNGN